MSLRFTVPLKLLVRTAAAFCLLWRGSTTSAQCDDYLSTSIIQITVQNTYYSKDLIQTYSFVNLLSISMYACFLQ